MGVFKLLLSKTLVLASRELVYEENIERDTEIWLFTDNQITKFSILEDSNWVYALHELYILL